jgi:non-lysosomal glucosylceramidase
VNERSFPSTATALAFPLGGIGTGNVSIGARGELCDWEIFNQPGKGRLLPNTFFSIRAQTGDAEPVTRVLEAQLQAPHTRSHGYHPSTAAGLPRLARATFHGAYPFARVVFDDPHLPVLVELKAFTPLIPLDPEDSGIPCAIMTYTVTNVAPQPTELTLVGSIVNPVGGLAFDDYGNLTPRDARQNVNEFRDEGELRGLLLRSEQFAPGDLGYGDLSLATTHSDVTVKRTWLRGAWYDFLQEFWDDLSRDGRLDDLGYELPSEPGSTDTGSLGLLDVLAPEQRRDYRFILTWFFPNRPDSWGSRTGALARNRYAARFDSSWAVARHVVENLPRLEAGTRRFHAALFGSTLPPAVVDAVSANIVPLRSTTCFWLADGRFFGYEGCFDDRGCCEGSCTHVWSYAQTLALLFPSLEREMRRIEFVSETEPDGYMGFRAFKTFGERFLLVQDGDEKPPAAADGQMGSIVRAYREWLLSGDRDWLETVWPGVRQAIAYAAAHWDNNGEGVFEGQQHNTYDIEFYGPNPLCSVYYLAALRAVEELARVVDDDELARRCRERFERGSQRLDELLWNGEYYVQRLDDVDAHKYQHGTGCLSDQLLGQLHARILGLGDLLPADHVRSAIGAVFAHNFRRGFGDHVNCQRTYVLNDEAGLLLCSWPRGGRPRFPFVYSDEVWTGIEYQVAAHLIYEGQLDDGLEIVEAVRARHDGTRRNPWNEVECGHHYARSMSSWALLLALSGFHFDMGRGAISFAPVVAASSEDDVFRCVWSCGRGWGTYAQRRDEATGRWQPELQVLGGDMTGVQVAACGQEWTL